MRPFSRFAAVAAIGLWLALVALGVEPPPDDAFHAFEQVLAMSRGAAAPNSHWQVELAAWADAEARWATASATLPASAQGLRSCWPPVDRARRLVERANHLFIDAREASGPEALERFSAHEALLRQTEAPLRAAEACERAARAGAPGR